MMSLMINTSSQNLLNEGKIMTIHIILPDPHAIPDHHNERFKWAGNLIASVKPDHVICLGDWADMHSLCTYDKGKSGFGNRRYQADVISALTAQTAFFEPIKRQKRKLPKFWMLHGNHEQRINRAIDCDPVQLEGVISIDDLGYKDAGWEEIPYDDSTPGLLQLDGVTYAHYFTSGVKGQPISSIHPAYTILAKQYMSCTQGHIHTFSHDIRTNASGRHMHGLVAGCFVDYWADWAGAANHLWYKGVAIKYDVEDGDYNLTWVGMKQLQEMYG